MYVSVNSLVEGNTNGSCLVPSHYHLNQCWSVNKILCNQIKWNLTSGTIIFIQENALKKGVWKCLQNKFQFVQASMCCRLRSGIILGVRWCYIVAAQGLSQPKIFTHRHWPLRKPNKTYRPPSPKKCHYIHIYYIHMLKMYLRWISINRDSLFPGIFFFLKKKKNHSCTKIAAFEIVKEFFCV